MEILSQAAFEDRAGRAEVFRYPTAGLSIALVTVACIAASLISLWVIPASQLPFPPLSPAARGYGLAILALVGWSLLTLRVPRSRSDTWLIRLDERGLHIKFRSYLNHHFDRDTPSILHLTPHEVAWARASRERRHLQGAERHHTRSLRHQCLELGLTDVDVDAIKVALDNEVSCLGPWEQRWYGRTRTRHKHHPVRLVDGNVLTIQYEVPPNIHHFLAAWNNWGEIAQSRSVSYDLRNMHKASPDTRDTQIRDLIARGETLKAIRTIRRAHGVGLAEARQIFETLEVSSSQSPPP